MTFHKVTSIPETVYRKPSNDLASAMDEFMKLNIKLARVEFTVLEFESCYVARSSLARCCRDAKLPIIVRVRNGIVYFERTDL